MSSTATEPRCVPLARRAELLEFAKADESGNLIHEHLTCEVCNHVYLVGPGGYRECPQCVEQEPSLNDLLQDRECWPGHGFLWHEERGPRGMWVLAHDYVPLPRKELMLIGQHLSNDTREMTFTGAVLTELTRLRTVIAEANLPHAERAEQQAKRALQLADECGQLKEALDRKRVECDELREQNESLRDGRSRNAVDRPRAAT